MKNFGPIITAQICEQREAGAKLSELATDFNTNATRIRGVLKEYQVNPTVPVIHNSRVTVADDHIDEICRRYLAGESIYGLAAALNVLPMTIYRRLKDQKVSLRRAGAGKAERHPRWKGRRLKTTDGYITIRTDEGRFFEHRLIMEQSIGRKLGSAELVHHKNKIKDDNCLKNLEIISRSEHAKYHGFGAKGQPSEKSQLL